MDFAPVLDLAFEASRNVMEFASRFGDAARNGLPMRVSFSRDCARPACWDAASTFPA